MNVGIIYIVRVSRDERVKRCEGDDQSIVAYRGPEAAVRSLASCAVETYALSETIQPVADKNVIYKISVTRNQVGSSVSERDEATVRGYHGLEETGPIGLNPSATHTDPFRYPCNPVMYEYVGNPIRVAWDKVGCRG